MHQFDATDLVSLEVFDRRWNQERTTPGSIAQFPIMSTQISERGSAHGTESTTRLDVLGDECARMILSATTECPQTAKELTTRTDSSTATVYRRINDLLESDLLIESVRFDDSGNHTKAYEARTDELRIVIGNEGIEVLIDVTE